MNNYESWIIEQKDHEGKIWSWLDLFHPYTLDPGQEKSEDRKWDVCAEFAGKQLRDDRRAPYKEIKTVLNYGRRLQYDIRTDDSHHQIEDIDIRAISIMELFEILNRQIDLSQWNIPQTLPRGLTWVLDKVKCKLENYQITMDEAVTIMDTNFERVTK